MRSIICGLGGFLMICANAFASCASEQATCTSSCVLGAALSKQFGGGNQCTLDCLSAANACEAREEQQRQMEQQRQQMLQQQQQQQAERQAQQAREARELAGKQQQIQKANEIAQRVSAEAAVQQQFEVAMEKGMQALDQKGYISAEYQFKAALKIKPNDLDAKAGLLRAMMGAGKRAAALNYANDQLLTLASQPPGPGGPSAYARWLEILSDNSLVGEAERSQIERVYPFDGGNPESAAAAFPKAYPRSMFLPFIRQIGGVMPAIRAEHEDRRKEAAQREKLEDEHWQQARKAATAAAMRAYITSYPNGRYVAEARKKEEEYLYPPPRPNLPFAVDESIWRTLEASELYRYWPQARAIRVHKVYQENLEFTNLDIAPDVKMHTWDIEIEPIGRKCMVQKMHGRFGTFKSESQSYSCGGIALGLINNGKYTPNVTILEQISGSLYPPRIGAERQVRYYTVEQSDRQYDSRTTSYCRMAARIEANQINARLNGVAWVLHCRNEFKFVGGHAAAPIVSEFEDYLIEDANTGVSSIGELDHTGKRYFLPTIGVPYLEAGDGYRKTTTYHSHEWAIGEARAQSAPPLAK